MQRPAMTTIGHGYPTSATCGAKTFDNLANKLHIPFVDDAKITGNSTALVLQSMFKEEAIPRVAKSKERAVNNSD